MDKSSFQALYVGAVSALNFESVPTGEFVDVVSYHSVSDSLGTILEVPVTFRVLGSVFDEWRDKLEVGKWFAFVGTIVVDGSLEDDTLYTYYLAQSISEV